MIHRNTRSILFTLLIIFFFTSACNSPLERKAEITITREFQLSESTLKHLSRMYPVVVDNPKADELAFSNYRSPIQIVLTDYNGNLVETVGKEGRGPREIISARNFGYDNEQNIVILDKAGGLFKKYDRTTGKVQSYVYPVNQGIDVKSRNLQMCEDKWYLAIQFFNKSRDKGGSNVGVPEASVPIVARFDTQFNVEGYIGGYDPFFKGRIDVLQEAEISVDCKSRKIYTTQAKIPYIQVYSMDDGSRIGRTTIIPPSFMLSDKFVPMVINRRERIRFLSEEQSLGLRLAYSGDYIFHIFANEQPIDNRSTQNRNFTDRDFFAAVYDKESLEYLGETKLPGPAIGSTKDGELIVLKDEQTSKFQFVNIEPVSASSD